MHFVSYLVAEGTTEALSKVWMPLEEFVPIVTKGLVAGTPHITAGMAEGAWDRFEKGKDEIVASFYKAH